MAKKKKSKEKVEKAAPKVTATPEIPKKEYELIEDVIIGNVLHYKGQKVALTQDGKNYFKSINKIR